MKRIFILVLILLPPGAFAQNPGDTIFSSAHIHEINISFAQPDYWDSLMYNKMHADSLNIETPYMEGNFSIDGVVIDSVGVKLKGNSSFGYPGRKKPIKLKFNEYISGQKLEGLEVIDLNNNMLDPTMMREKLLLDFMNKKGLPAPRCTYARVSYNGEYVGLYKIIEQVDEEFIKSHFANWGGNLFKGDPAGTLGWIDTSQSSYYPYYELHSNEVENDWSDLLHFINNINFIPDIYDSLENNLNTNSFIAQWAARNLFVDLDAYFHAAHNYYLYHNTSTGKFEWCTWDVSVAFGFYPGYTEDSTEHTSILMAFNPLVIRMVNDSAYLNSYLNTVCDYLAYFNPPVLFPLIDSIAERIYPDFAAEPDSNQMFPEELLFATADSMTLPTDLGEIPGLKKFISNRRTIVIDELNSLNRNCPYNEIPEEQSNTNAIEIFPDPFTYYSKLVFGNIMHDATIIMLNEMGQKVMESDHVSGKQIMIYRNALPAGLYFIYAEENNAMLYSGKCIITNR